jgi:hypothetical protein
MDVLELNKCPWLHCTVSLSVMDGLRLEQDCEAEEEVEREDGGEDAHLCVQRYARSQIHGLARVRVRGLGHEAGIH